MAEVAEQLQSLSAKPTTTTSNNNHNDDVSICFISCNRYTVMHVNNRCGNFLSMGKGRGLWELDFLFNFFFFGTGV
jgi:hypothetical protein